MAPETHHKLKVRCAIATVVLAVISAILSISLGVALSCTCEDVTKCGDGTCTVENGTIHMGNLIINTATYRYDTQCNFIIDNYTLPVEFACTLACDQKGLIIKGPVCMSTECSRARAEFVSAIVFGVLAIASSYMAIRLINSCMHA